MTSFKKVTHVIFDLDGTLIDSESVYHQIVSEILAKYDKEYTPDIIMKVKGSTQEVSISTILHESQLPITYDDFFTEYKAQEMIRLGNPDLLPGGPELIKHLHKHGIPMALATSSSQSVANLKMQSHDEIFSLLHHKVVGSDPLIKNPKPAPDIFLLCARRFPNRPRPAKCLVFEDSHNGVMAGLRAGMQVVMVPAAETPLESCEATLVLNTLKDFNPEWFGLPAWSDR